MSLSLVRNPLLSFLKIGSVFRKSVCSPSFAFVEDLVEFERRFGKYAFLKLRRRRELPEFKLKAMISYIFSFKSFMSKYIRVV